MNPDEWNALLHFKYPLLTDRLKEIGWKNKSKE